MDLLDKHGFPFPASFPCNASTFTKVFISATIFRKTEEELSFLNCDLSLLLGWMMQQTHMGGQLNCQMMKTELMFLDDIDHKIVIGIVPQHDF